MKIQVFFELLGNKPYTDDNDTEKNADGSVKTIWQRELRVCSPEALLKAMDSDFDEA